MIRPIKVVALVEGRTEEIFVKTLLSPYLQEKRVDMTPIILSKSGENGGDVRFARAKNDIERHLKQKQETWLTLLVDYYGIKSDWPGYKESRRETQHASKARVMNEATRERVNKLFGDHDSERRFIPYVSMFEFEALLFSDAKILAQKLNVELKVVERILARCGEPEKINDKSQTAPSKRLEDLSDKKFKKTVTGINIAQTIGIDKMRKACPIFNKWITELENLRN